jgi:hypothetical protein
MTDLVAKNVAFGLAMGRHLDRKQEDIKDKLQK